MEKTLNIDGRDVKFKTSGAFAKRYKAQFKRDAIKDIFLIKEMGETLSEGKIPMDSDLDIIYDLIWSFAKNANPDLPEPLEWYSSFEVFPVIDVLVEIMDLITASFSTSVMPKKKQAVKMN